MLQHILREIIQPSDRGVVSPFRRVVRRSIVLSCGLATLIAAGLCVVSYTGPSTRYLVRAFDFVTLSVGWGNGRDPIPDDTYVGTGPFVDPWLSLSAFRGQIDMTCKYVIAKGTIVPRQDFKLAGFGWIQLPMGTLQLPTRNVGVGVPGWAVVILFCGWPILAFIRGPYRRATEHRKMHGLCVQCSYNLTGNESGVCPECGTAIEDAEPPVR